MEKQIIIDAIKRTADDNGGTPLGRKQFENETGIKQSDWYPYIWLRWSDALHEAGYIPNKFQKAFNEDTLIEKYVQLIGKLGHFPVHGELKLQARADKSFPAHTVMSFGRFGGKRNLCEKIVEFCKGKGNLYQVEKICSGIISSEPVKIDSKSSFKKTDIVGSVYLMKSGKYYKIGKSNSVGRRQYEMSPKLPEELNVVHEIRTDDPNGIEAYWHKRFEKKRLKGEWFNLDSDDIKTFKRRKYM